MKAFFSRLYAAWMKLGKRMGAVTNPVFITALYLVVILPIALLMKAFGKDPLRRRFEPQAKSYWITRTSTISMKELF